MFKPVSNKVQFPQMEEGILKYWAEGDVFRKSLDRNRGKERYTFYDGPPFATGLPHYGHLLAGTIKDIVPRYQTMRGKYVERRFGWDTHGLPIEALAQEALGVAGAPEIKKIGGEWHGIWQTADANGPIPAPLAAIATHWMRLVLPSHLAR